MNRVVYYARVSTEEDGQLNALDNQVNMLEDFIYNNLDWTLVDKYIDKGKTGTTTKTRKSYNLLYEDLESDKFDIVVVKDISRLNRNTLEYYKFIDRMVQNNKKLFLLTDNKFYESDDALINGIKAILASEYSRDISKKVRAGHKQRMKEGKSIITNGNMWGYDQLKGSKTVKINEKEAEIIRKIFNWYIEGKGFRTIFKLLEEEDIRNRNNEPFSMTTLKRIVKNEKYKGTVISNKTTRDFDTKKLIKNPESEWIIHEDIIPAIISKEVWDKANYILSNKKKKRVVENKEIEAGYFVGSHKYSGKIVCGRCGEKFWHTIIGKKDLWQCKEYRNYGLNKENKKHGCWNIKLLTDDLDNICRKVIFDFIENKEEKIKNVIDALNKVLETDNNQNELIKLKKELDKLLIKKDKLIDFLTEELITKDDYINKKKKFDYEIEKLKKDILIIEETSNQIETKKGRLNTMKEFLNKSIVKVEDISNEYIESFIEKIIIKNENELDIILTTNITYKVNKECDNDITSSNQYVSTLGSNRYV